MTLLWAGLATGAVYALVGLAFTIVLTSSDVFNFAQPQFVMLGAFLGYWGLSETSLPLVVIVAGTLIVGAALGYLEEIIAIRPLRKRPNAGYAVLVTTVGFSVALNGLALVIWGSTPAPVSVPNADKIFHILGGSVSVIDLVLITLALVVGLSLHYAARRTSWGMAGRAIAADGDLAVARGVDAPRFKTTGFVLAGAFACAVGVFIGAKLSANINLGNSLVILGFVGLAVGGMGSYVGALVGGLVIGVIQVLTSRYIGAEYELVVLFVVLLSILLLRPAGILGGRQFRTV
ncbi:branched-chain amino acid ABC transporter permease [Rhodococcoides yunnanense]|uniref:branched-chain amino acid ABC transporter permease n=1 Tax=Rhodococcoides yunnanense TaxID=278209 RepID=UPI000932343D|nr:branched-chain amino acid ABC transporter permease [Rhodococcus yunnanensis]